MLKRTIPSVLLFTVVATLAFAQVTPPPTTIQDFFLPGSQPGQSGQLETPDKCDNCHGGYDQAVEPAFNWRGSMMAQAARDPFFYACMAIANQDAPESGDLCIRCHSPAGWLEGRSIPTDGSALNQNDRQGVQCDFCHKLVKPTALGVNPYPGDAAYTSGTYNADQVYLATLTQLPAFSADGMYIADNSNAKRGPFTDPVARHQFYYSPFHKEAAICGTCHDVSNPAFSWDAARGDYWPNSFGQPAPDFNPYSLFPVERTYSEWLMSAYNTPAGVYAPQFGGNKTYVSTCQDCHMKDVTGVGCNKAGAPTRTDLPLHDMTGGNTVVPVWVSQIYTAEIDQAALNAGVARARAMLQKAASLAVTVTETGVGYEAAVRVTNETGHKLPSGYPEGRRIWLNVKALGSAGEVIYESGAYDPATAVLTHDADAKIYEIEPGVSSGLSPVVNIPAGKSFHFVLNNKIYKDNRIPPRGFNNANFAAIGSPPIGATYADAQYWDDTVYSLPAETYEVRVTLYYQTTSKDYVEFLRNENRTNTWGQRLYDLWAQSGKSAPEVMASRTVVLRTIVDTQPPTAPTNLTATGISTNQMALAWTASTDNVAVTGYRIYRDGTQVGTTSATSFTDSGLRSSTAYSYYVIAYDAAGNLSSASNTATGTTTAKGGKGGKPLGAATVFLSPPAGDGRVEVQFYLAEPAPVRIEVFDVTGRLVAEVANETRSAGHHSVYWAPDRSASGIYLVRAQIGAETQTGKVTVLKR